MKQIQKEAALALLKASREVWQAYLGYGPVDDGRPEGDRFSDSLDELMKATVDARLVFGK